MALERLPPTEAEVKAKKAEEKFLREQELADLRAVLSTPEGRRLVWRLLEHAGILRTIFDPDPRVSAFKEGGRNEGHWLYAEVMTAAPEQFIRMLQEHTKRTRGDNG